MTLGWLPSSDEWPHPLIGAEVNIDAPGLQQVVISESALNAMSGRFEFVLPNVRPGPLALSVNPGATGPTVHVSSCRGFEDCISRQVFGAPPIEVQAVAAPPQPLSDRELMARMSNFAWGRDPEPASDARVRSDAEIVCLRAKRGDFNSAIRFGVFSSRRWMQIQYRMENPGLDIRNAARCEAARLMRLAAQRPCSDELVAATHRCDDLPDAGSSPQ